jgi:radical SAM protein with 4Fe4S-binding SPASM domain
MSIELRPLGVACNLGCLYCYQNPQRQAGNVAREYDIEAMKRAVEAEGGAFTLFGGEPLLVPLDDLETLWSWGLEKFGRNGIQTNGALITAAHIDLFRRFKVSVGISIDGPEALNDVRWMGTIERTREATQRTERAIEMLIEAKVIPSLIVTLHRHNAIGAALDTMRDWLRRLDASGIRNVRLHLLESESAAVRERHALSAEENVHALLAFASLERELVSLRFDIFRELEQLLNGRDEAVSCVWRACDPYTTSAVRGVEGHGRRSNCGRTNKDGIDFVKSARASYERYVALYRTPQDSGGCADCRFFLMCKGQCPGTAIDGDWRNRTEHCETWKRMFEEVESAMLARGERPLTRRDELHELELRAVEAWRDGRNPSIAELLA